MRLKSCPFSGGFSATCKCDLQNETLYRQTEKVLSHNESPTSSPNSPNFSLQTLRSRRDIWPIVTDRLYDFAILHGRHQTELSRTLSVVTYSEVSQIIWKFVSTFMVHPSKTWSPKLPILGWFYDEHISANIFGMISDLLFWFRFDYVAFNSEDIRACMFVVKPSF